MVSVVIADPHAIVRHGLKLLLEHEKGVRVIGEAASASKVLELVGTLDPSVLLLDPSFPGADGLEIIRMIARTRTRILIFSVCLETVQINDALQAGAHGYLSKTTTPANLPTAIRTVAANRNYLSPDVSRALISGHFHNSPGNAAHGVLTSREKQVLSLSAEGHEAVAISERLGIRRSTVETHRTNAMSKLGLHSQTDVVRYALRAGLIRL